jgi:hypothetical protein
MTKRASYRANRIWKRLTDYYGARIGEQFGKTPPEDWCEIIDRTDDERLQAAMTEIRMKHLDFPPTLPQFQAAIPARKDHGVGSLIERLEDAAQRLALCPHQEVAPRWWFGSQWRDARGHLNGQVAGMVIGECRACNAKARRLTARDLADVEFALPEPPPDYHDKVSP